ncbi:hypothetical protein WA026_001355 [Henosepilachna vigintioctopunctata]|uniref:RRM domain-containing protein n=1 Tax=Henosepilachna vigintioctopunctata TaxID=420089 RepID=A0AAW1URK6_9CUCU
MDDDNDASGEEESADDEEESADDEEESADEEEESVDDEEDSEDEDGNEKINKVVAKQNGKVVEVENQKVDVKNKNKNQLEISEEVEHKHYSITKDELEKHFERVGNVVDVKIPTEKDSNKPRGFGYVEFADEAGYQSAFELNSSQFSNRKIEVEYTQEGNNKSENQESKIKSTNFKLRNVWK